jgi:hypothetical protein
MKEVETPVVSTPPPPPPVITGHDLSTAYMKQWRREVAGTARKIWDILSEQPDKCMESYSRLRREDGTIVIWRHRELGDAYATRLKLDYRAQYDYLTDVIRRFNRDHPEIQTDMDPFDAEKKPYITFYLPLPDQGSPPSMTKKEEQQKDEAPDTAN